MAAAINRAALLLAIALLVAIAGQWTRERLRPHAAVRWDAAAFVALVPPAAGPAARWLVAVNPECSHCRDRLAARAGALAQRAAPPALGVLLVDTPRRPDSLVGGAGFPAGVWWDSAGTWRGRWRRSRYGEVLVFAPNGVLRAILPPDSSRGPGTP